LLSYLGKAFSSCLSSTEQLRTSAQLNDYCVYTHGESVVCFYPDIVLCVLRTACRPSFTATTTGAYTYRLLLEDSKHHVTCNSSLQCVVSYDVMAASIIGVSQRAPALIYLLTYLLSLVFLQAQQSLKLVWTGLLSEHRIIIIHHFCSNMSTFKPLFFKQNTCRPVYFLS